MTLQLFRMEATYRMEIVMLVAVVVLATTVQCYVKTTQAASSSIETRAAVAGTLGAGGGMGMEDEEAGSCNSTFYARDISDMRRPVRLLPVSLPPHLLGRLFHCHYSLRASPGQRIVIRLTALLAGTYDLNRQRCVDGHMKIWDGMRQPGMHAYPPNTFCGWYNNGDIDVTKVTSRHSADIEFLVSNANQYYTFALTFKYVNIEKEMLINNRFIREDVKPRNTTTVCSWDVVVERCHDHQCIFSSPGYPGIYPPNTDCFYHVTSSDDDVAIQLSFRPDHTSDTADHFDIQQSTHCIHEYVEVRDGPTAFNNLIGRFCGQQVSDITSTGPSLYLAFFTRHDSPPYDRTGFQAFVQSVTKEWHEGGVKGEGQPCDWTFTAVEGSVSSPEHWLPPNTKCSYQFQAPAHHYFDMRINIYGLSADCSTRLVVHDSGRIVARLCDLSQRSDSRTFHYNATGSLGITVEYYLREGQMQADQLRGFWLSYRWVPDNAVISETQRMQRSDSSGSGVSIFVTISCFPSLVMFAVSWWWAQLR